METAWIQVFVLTLTECVAPAGKTICQEREFEMQFVDRGNCELALEQMIWLAEGASDVIINREKSGCSISAVERPVYGSLEEVAEKYASSGDWKAPASGDKAQDFTQKAHKERLAVLQTCEESCGETPCKIGEIIIEGATEQSADVDVWRRKQ